MTKRERHLQAQAQPARPILTLEHRLFGAVIPRTHTNTKPSNPTRKEPITQQSPKQPRQHSVVDRVSRCAPSGTRAGSPDRVGAALL